MTIELDENDRRMLRECPFTLITPKQARPTKPQLERLQRVKRLWAAGYLGGTVGQDGQTMRVVIRNLGRVAIDQTPVTETIHD